MAFQPKKQTSEPPSAQTAPVATTINPKSGAKVVVCCKLPNGMELTLDKKIQQQEATLNGFRTIDIWVKDDDKPKVRVHGNRARFGESPSWEIVAGYGMTPNVDKDFWDAWFEQNKGQDYVKNNIIFALPDLASAKDRAKQFRPQLSGFEPLNPATKITRLPDGSEGTTHVDPRWPRRLNLTAGKVGEVEEMEQ
jgi:hypothetical protein